MSLGQLVYKYVYDPTAGMRYKFHHFGAKGWYNYNQGEIKLKKAAREMPSVTLPCSENPLTINYLTGDQYWHQTIFGIQSLINNFGTNLAINMYSDGTLHKGIIETFKSYCPQIAIISTGQIMENLNTIIPADRYPSLHFLRNWNAFFKRMIDIHCKLEWVIHLDSDMLFFKYPHELAAYANQSKAFFMQEQMGNSYFVDDPEMLFRKHNITTVQNVNGGIIAYDGKLVDYQRLEIIAKILLDNYFKQGPARIEQTLMSYILSTQSGVPLNKDAYKIYYNNVIDAEDNATLRHYIFKAKQPYFSSEWKNIL